MCVCVFVCVLSGIGIPALYTIVYKGSACSKTRGSRFDSIYFLLFSLMYVKNLKCTK